MEKLTKALMTDETGQAIVTKLNALSRQMHELAMATRGSAILFESESDISVLGDGGYLAVYVGSINPLEISGWTGDNSLVTGHLYYLVKSGTAVTSSDLGEYGGTAVTSTTFNQHGVPADDFAVGEALAEKADSDDVTALDTRVTAVEGDILELQDGGYVADQQKISEKINDWLEEHPEATTTVQDNSLTAKKLVIGTLGYVTPEDFGAKGDGVTDDTQAFQDALDSGYAVHVDGNYIVNHVVVQKDAKLELSPNTRITRTETQSINQSGIFEFRGTEAESSALTADGTEDAQSVTVADGSIFAKDNTVVLKCSGSGEVANKKLVSIVTDVSGNVITLSNPLQWGYAVSDGATLTKINPITVNIIGNGAVVDGGGLVGRGYAFYMSYCINSHIEGIAVENSATGVMRMDFCHNVTIERCAGKNPVSNSEPYGEFLSIAYSTLVTAKKIVTEKYRRCVDYIGAVYCKTYDSYAYVGGFNTHGLLARFCEFVGCHSVVAVEAIAPTSGVGNTTYYYDKDITFRDCRFEGGNRGFHCICANSTVKLIGCILRNSRVNIFIESGSAEIYDCIIESRRTTVSVGGASSSAFVKGCKIVSTGSGSYTAITNLGSAVFEDCSFGISTQLIKTQPIQMKNCKVNCSVSTAGSVASGTKIIDSVITTALTVADASNVSIVNSIIKNVLASGTNTYVLISNLLTWDGTMGFETDATNHIEVYNSQKTGFAPLT